ncbi:MAG: hypothetical protein M3404_06625 [Actinomycetota bacterium]|nr:hypothetical protein [Actinomycetota bacterium]
MAHHPPPEERQAWWARWQEEDPPATHVVTFRPVIRARLAVAPGADPTAVIEAAAASWDAALHSHDQAGNRWLADFWSHELGEDALVLSVESLDSTSCVEAERPTAPAEDD